MKATIERNALLKALNHIQNVVERRATIPILSNVLLVAESDTLALTATDMQIEMREKITANIETPGRLTASAHMLHEIVRHTADGAQIELSYNASESWLMVQSGRSQFTLQTLPQEDFHFMTQEEMPVSFALPIADLCHLLRSTRDAISTEETRYYLNGVYFHIHAEDDNFRLRAVTSDGHRLAMAQIEKPVGADNMPAIIIPRKTTSELLRLLEDATGEIALQISETAINFAFGDILLTSKLIDGQFPDYIKVIPSTSDKSFGVDAAVLTESVERVASILSERSKAVKIEIKENHLILNVNNPQNASAIDEVTITYEGEPITFSFNAQFLKDALAQFTKSPAIIEFTDATSSILIHAEDDTDMLYVLMPMRV